MRVAALVCLTLVLALGGCATTYAIRPAHGGPVAIQSASGLTLAADPNAWDADPYDLPNYMTPVAVRITNRSGQDVRISYVDFALTNEQGFRFAAVNPYATQMGPPVGELPASPEAQAVTLAAGSPAAIEESRVVVAAARVYGGGRVTVVPGRRFFVYPRTRHVFRYYDPWPYGFSEPPYYDPYVTPWNQSHYYSYNRGNPSGDILRLGLPEGVVRSGGEVSGFVYFQNAGQRSNRLQLTWVARTADGRALATLQAPFVVVPE